MARALTAALALCLAAPAAAQRVPPRVEVRKAAGAREHPRSAAGLVGVGNCLVTMAQPEVEELASVSVELRGPWERSAEHLAKQAAAELGANCLMPLSRYEPEGDAYPLLRQYRAFLVTTVVTGALGTFRVPAPARAFSAPGAAAAAVPPLPALRRPAPPPPEEVPHGPVWFEHAALESHDVVLDLARMDEAEWEMVHDDVAAYFPAAALRALTVARAHGETVVLDLRERRVSVLAR